MKIIPKCLKPWYGFDVDDSTEEWGGVRPCCWAMKYAGNLLEDKPESVWNGKIFQEYRKRLLNGNTDGYCPPYCPYISSKSSDISEYLGVFWRNPKIQHLKNFLEIITRKKELLTLPLSLKISPTLSCNLHCVMCYQNHTLNKELPDKVIDDFLRIASRAQIIQIQGGEVFASQKGLSFIEKLSKKNPSTKMSFVTNGTFPIIDAWKYFDEINLGWVLVSLDSACEKTYNLIRTGGDWKKVLSNLQRLILMSRVRKYKVLLSFTVMSINYEEMKEFVILSSELGVDVIFSSVWTTNSHSYLDPIKNEDIKPYVRLSINSALNEANNRNMKLAISTLQGLANYYS